MRMNLKIARHEAYFAEPIWVSGSHAFRGASEEDHRFQVLGRPQMHFSHRG